MYMSERGERPYLDIVRHYESCLKQFGDTHRGVDWPKAEDVETRYRVMLDLIRRPGVPCTLLDFGCGASHLYEYIRGKELAYIAYSGLDISPKFVALCRQKFQNVEYYCMDVLQDESGLPRFDYVVMNGVFTEKRSLSQDQMLEYFKALIVKVFANARIGIAFNVMSKHVDWEREDLFHLSQDALAAFLVKHVSRHFVVRNDYGLYEYTTYVYRQPGLTAFGAGDED